LGCALVNGNKNGKKPETFCYMLHICVDPPLYAINTILVWFIISPTLSTMQILVLIGSSVSEVG
jgi:hypothetical protein